VTGLSYLEGKKHAGVDELRVVQSQGLLYSGYKIASRKWERPKKHRKHNEGRGQKSRGKKVGSNRVVRGRTPQLGGHREGNRPQKGRAKRSKIPRNKSEL